MLEIPSTSITHQTRVWFVEFLPGSALPIGILKRLVKGENSCTGEKVMLYNSWSSYYTSVQYGDVFWQTRLDEENEPRLDDAWYANERANRASYGLPPFKE